ncbi:MAG: DNA mismatch repair endonuclease MutL [Ruminococcaceae bacterium]|nr:DNA mismatch repair endonuclease MutL [Oscillospiraceae bacterium]
MGIINILDFSVANLIAAGEVVDRPASVIKELLENSIDAGADDITVEIKRGGISFMRVSDNGKGISKEDMPVAIKRHATSKIKDANDLSSILTLGFRGEALAAIASVSKLRIMSKTRDSSVGYILESVSGDVKSINEAGCPDGTTVIVENLFENVPARLKFLKKDTTEAMAVSAYVEKIALSRPDISIKLIIDGNMKFMTSGDSKLYNAIYVLFGRDFAKRLIPVELKHETIRVWGYISTPDNIRANRNFQNFFINGRYIKSKTVSAALEQAYSTFIPADKFPCAILNLDITPSSVDVNVHPAKLEVKFSNEKLIFDSVYSTVRQALESKIERPELKMYASAPGYHNSDYTKKLNPFVPIGESREVTKEQISFTYQSPDSQINKKDVEPSVVPQGSYTVKMTGSETLNQASYPTHSTVTAERKAPFDDPFKSSQQDKTKFLEVKPTDEVEEVKPHKPLEVNAIENKPPQFRLIGEAFYSYVFAELEDSVLIIDKHAAHERIIFEELKNNLRNRQVVSQYLIAPIDVILTDTEASAVKEYADEIKQTGFEFKVYGNTVSITQIPIELDQEGVVPMIETVADRLSSGTGNVALSKEMIYEKALFQASCKAAVKIGHRHDEEYIKWICERIIKLDIIKFCPHGRPVAFELTKRDFERQFKRV